MHLPAGARRGAVEIVIARSLLRVKPISLASELSSVDRWSALRAQALAWQPFERAGLRFGLQGLERGVAFAWDADTLDGALVQAGIDATQVRLVPESSLVAPPDHESIVLWRCMEGFEAQLWSEGTLRASRWWAQLPTETEWQEFCHACAAPQELACPTPQEASLGIKPWLALRSPTDGGAQQRRAERMLVAGLGMVLIGASVPVIHEHVSLQSRLKELGARIELARAESQPALQARERAIALQQRSDKLVESLRAVPPMQVLQHLAEVLPKDGVTLKEFDLEGLRLKLVLELAPGISRGKLVESMQTGGWFAEVSEQPPLPQPGWVGYSVRLTGVHPRAEAVSTKSGT